MKIPPSEIHPVGENPKHQIAQVIDKIAVDTYGGRVYIDWDHETPVTALGQLSFFIEFLKRTELFDHWVGSLSITINQPECACTQRYFRYNFIICFIGTYALFSYHDGEDRQSKCAVIGNE